MPRPIASSFLGVGFLLLLTVCLGQTAPDTQPNTSKNGPRLNLHVERASPLDLEVAGNLAGFPKGAKRYVRREDLGALPQVNFTVRDDANFSAPAEVRGVELQTLLERIGGTGSEAVIVAVCKDWYRGYFPQAYVQAHRPVLALEINGQPPSGWPKRGGDSGPAMGPYLVTHAQFTPSFKILAHEDEAQIPWGVVRLEFRDQKSAFGAITPRGPKAAGPAVQAGYGIAQQNCLRCHGPESLGPLKGKLTWAGIALFASQAPKNFAAYVRNPQAQSRDAEMPANPAYDDPTLQALIAYFQTFAAPEKR